MEGSKSSAIGQRALVLHPFKNSESFNRNPEARLEEALGLAEAINLRVCAGEIIKLNRTRASTLLGLGALDACSSQISDKNIEVVIIDCALTPIQQRNLERHWNCKVIDRTGLILEIFGSRARTREGRLQVELAHLTYQRSRLVRSWNHLERQRGGVGFLGGPGETQIESDRRQIDTRIGRIQKDLERVKRTRDLHRKARKRVPYPIVALVGYTNAGKSTLFNYLSGAEVISMDQLFATLDPTMRALELTETNQKIILSDTVGFVSSLPTLLIAAFRATLEEVLEADLIVHVRDISHPETNAQREDVIEVLRDLGIPEEGLSEIIEVRNKVDLLDLPRSECEEESDLIWVSAKTGEGVSNLEHELLRRLNKDHKIYEVDIPHSAGAALAWLHRHGNVMTRQVLNSSTFVEVSLASDRLSQFVSHYPQCKLNNDHS
ncbi:MAG: GTPase HflX [Rhodospirillaceae bacterium]